MKAVISLALVALFIITATGCNEQSKEENPIEYGG